MKKITFVGLLWKWFLFALVVMFINCATIKSWVLNSIVDASLGVFLLIHPVYPDRLEWHYGKEKATKIVRIIAVVEIILSFFVRTTF